MMEAVSRYLVSEKSIPRPVLDNVIESKVGREASEVVDLLPEDQLVEQEPRGHRRHGGRQETQAQGGEHQHHPPEDVAVRCCVLVS